MRRTTQKVIDKRVSDIVSDYSSNRSKYDLAAQRLVEDLSRDAILKELIHSSKFRSKDPDHLRDKLLRKAKEFSENSEPFLIQKNNYTEHIEDLAGCRLLHIHTKQIEGIHPRLLEVLEVYKYKLVSEPVSYTWDIENQKIFEDIGIKVQQRDSFYTSTHYIIQPPGYPAKCELQVRTLAEELWSEVSHTINYPDATTSIACKEQLLALARFSSGCTRLVDSLYASKKEHESMS